MPRTPFTAAAIGTAAVLAVAGAGCSQGDASGAETAAAGTAVDVTRLPLGDGKASTRPRRGYVYSCRRSFPENGGGSQEAGPWIDEEAGTWNLEEKVAVQGSRRFDSSFSQRLSGGSRRLRGNGLPAHPAGAFPIASGDPAYQYDRNPNSIRSQSLAIALAATPRRASGATCAGGTVGVMRNGTPLFSAFDAAGRDAVAREVQDACSGHPERSGLYHYHGIPACLSDTGRESAHSRLLGWALDGHGIYGRRGEGGRELASADLDGCHGHTHTIRWRGKRRRMYHHHATLDFPYAVGCFRGTDVASEREVVAAP